MKSKSPIHLVLTTMFFLGLISCNKNIKTNLKSNRNLASTPSENLICEDLFSAACVNPDGSLKDVAQEQNQETTDILELAQRRALTAMGYASVDEAMADRLSKEGVEASVSPDGLSLDLGLGVDSCDEMPISGNNQSRHVSVIQKFYSKDLNNFLFYLAQKCAESTNLVQFASLNDNFSQCKEQLRLRTEVSNIYRLPNSQQRLKAEAFVYENFKYIVPFRTEQRAENDLCELAIDVQNERVNQIATDLRTEIQTSRPYVESVINNFYSPENIKLAQEQFSEVSRQLSSIYSEINPNSPNAETFNSSMQTFSIKTVTKPPSTDYRINENGTSVLKDKTGFVESNSLTYTDIFSDLSSSYFYDLNAVYNSPVEVRANSNTYSIDSEVTMMPAYWGLIETHPEVFYSTLAHEVGHRFSPSATEYEGYSDLNSKFDKLFECFSQNGSINMSETMKDEVLADYISSEILARRLASINSPEQRRERLIEAMGHMCSFESSHLANGLTSPRDGFYPPNNHRCSGIYGANQNIRKLIGCEGESSQYKTCGLNLSLGTANASIPGSDTDVDRGTE